MIYWNNNTVKTQQVSPAFRSLSYKSMRFPINNQTITKNTMKFNKKQEQIPTNNVKGELKDIEGCLGLKASQGELKEPQKEWKPKVFGAIMRYKEPNTLETYYALIQGRYTQKWSFPKGHSNKGEEPYDCVKREVYEETGINNLPNPTSDGRVGFGHYYVFDVETKYEINPQDKKEVMNYKWATLEEMTTLQLNVDASYFKRSLLSN